MEKRWKRAQSQTLIEGIKSVNGATINSKNTNKRIISISYNLAKLLHIRLSVTVKNFIICSKVGI